MADRFSSMDPVGWLTWIDSNSEIRFGKFLRHRERAHPIPPPQSRRLGRLDNATSRHGRNFWPAPEHDEFVGGRPIANDPNFAMSAMGMTPEHLLASSGMDVVIVGTLTELEADQKDRSFSARGHRGALIDTVRPDETVPLGQRHRSTLVSSVAEPDSISVQSSQCPAIFDGPSAYLRLRDELASTSNIVIVDRWQPWAEDCVAAAVIERNETFIGTDPVSLPPAPPGWRSTDGPRSRDHLC